MKTSETTLLLSLLFLFSCSCFTLNNAHSTTILNVWPKPRNLSWAPPHQATLIASNFTITTPTPHHNKHLSAAITRYRNLVISEHHHPLVPPEVNVSKNIPPLEFLTLVVHDPDAGLVHGVDESYTLSIFPSSAILTAKTTWGAIRGLETFSQLVWGRPSCVAVGVRVWDSPLYAHRGITLDTSRNYYPVKDLLRTVEAMSMNKLNVFHWHLTDSQSFPLVLPSESSLAEKGAYASHMVYTPEDVKMIVEFGLDHGVRVLP